MVVLLQQLLVNPPNLKGRLIHDNGLLTLLLLLRPPQIPLASSAGDVMGLHNNLKRRNFCSPNLLFFFFGYVSVIGYMHLYLHFCTSMFCFLQLYVTIATTITC